MIAIDVRADIRGAKAFLQELGGRGSKRATSRALNKTATTVRAEAARLLQQKRALPISEIKKAMTISTATTQRLVAQVIVSGRAISIRHFARAGVRGVTVRIEKGGKRTRLMRHGNKAFINAAWRPGVFVRTGKKRLPIQAWPRVPGLPSVLLQAKVTEAVKAVAAATFPKRLAEEINYEINVAARRGR